MRISNLFSIMAIAILLSLAMPGWGFTQDTGPATAATATEPTGTTPVAAGTPLVTVPAAAVITNSICVGTKCLKGVPASLVNWGGLLVMLATLVINYGLKGQTSGVLGKILSFIAEMKFNTDQKEGGFAVLAILAVFLMGGSAGLYIQAQHNVVNDHSAQAKLEPATETDK